MADEKVGQSGTENSAPGRFGLYTQHDTDLGNPQGDVVDSTYSKNDVKAINFLQVRDLQGTGTTFFYPYGRNQQQMY